MQNNYHNINEKENLHCVVERITYQNRENGYKVLKCSVKGSSDLVTVIGIMPDTNIGSTLLLTGYWKIDAKYGRQFCVQAFEETLPATVEGIEKYLGSGLVKGIGPAYAKRIVSAFGFETLDIIENEPEKLLTIHGIGRGRVDRIRKSWADQKEIKDIMIFLQGHGVSTSHATKIYKKYGSESIQKVRENPYRLADDIWGIGFKTADTIAAKMGFGHEKYERLRSGLMYTLNKLADGGHCYSTKDVLFKTAAELLELNESLLSEVLDKMIAAEDVKIEPLPAEIDQPAQMAIYLPPFYFAENGTAKRLQKIASSPRRILIRNAQHLQSDFPYDHVQLEAIRTAAQNKILILTGGPGTGKTTTTLGIINAYKSAKANILLAAPTGRAAKRLSETTRMDAKTIHRLLEFNPSEGYQRNQDNPK